MKTMLKMMRMLLKIRLMKKTMMMVFVTVAIKILERTITVMMMMEQLTVHDYHVFSQGQRSRLISCSFLSWHFLCWWAVAVNPTHLQHRFVIVTLIIIAFIISSIILNIILMIVTLSSSLLHLSSSPSLYLYLRPQNGPHVSSSQPSVKA